MIYITEKKKNRNEEIKDAGLAGSSNELIGRYGDAAYEFIKGYSGECDQNNQLFVKGLKQIADSKVNPDFEYANLKQQAGFSAERHFVSKENAGEIIKGSHLRFSRSNDVGRGNDQLIDILAVDINGNPIIDNGQPLWSAQMKFCGRFETADDIVRSSERLARELASDKWAKYRGNKVLVPSEQYEHIRHHAQEKANELYEQSAAYELQGNLDKAAALEAQAKNYEQVCKDVTDSGISSKEAMFLREYPELATAKYIAETAHNAGLEQAKAGAVISGVISISQNIIGVMRSEKELKEALIDTSLTVTKGAASSYIIGATGTAVKGFMKASNNEVITGFSKTNMPALIATATVQVGQSLLRYANGEINALQLAEEIGEKGTGMVAASWGAAIGTAIFPGIGTVVGGMIGYMSNSILYTSAMQVLQENRLSHARREKIRILAEVSICTMKKQRQELNTMITAFYNNRKAVFDQGFSLIEASAEADNLELYTEGLNMIAIEMGKALQFKNFEDFDSFMLDKQAVFEF